MSQVAQGLAQFDLTGRIALVTGASKGIGAEAARALDGAGATVVLCARDVRRLENLSGELGRDTAIVRADLADPAGVADLLSRIGDAVDRVDILVNNAGAHRPGRAHEISVENWDAVQAVNLRAAFLLARGLAPQMAACGWGKIINVSSVLGLLGDAGGASYIASKAGLLGLTRALAVEWAASGVCVNALCPGWTETEMVADLRSAPAFDRRVRRRTPAGRWGTPADLRGAIVFLASRASDFVVGQSLVVDGGLAASW